MLEMLRVGGSNGIVATRHDKQSLMLAWPHLV